MIDITKDKFWNMLNEPEPIIERYPNGIKSYRWYNEKSELHRDNDLPADIWYHEDGSIYRKLWYQNHKLHRDDGPAIIWSYSNGSIEEERWHQNGEIHRIGGPAVIWYHIDGSINLGEWYLYGKEYDKKRYKQILRRWGCD